MVVIIEPEYRHTHTHTGRTQSLAKKPEVIRVRVGPCSWDLLSVIHLLHGECDSQFHEQSVSPDRHTSIHGSRVG